MSYSRPLHSVDGMTSLKVDNLTYRTGPSTLRRIFRKYGRIGDVYIPKDRFTKRSRGFAFVRFYSKRQAQEAIDALDGVVVDGQEMRVQMSCYGRPADLYHGCREMPTRRCKRHHSKSRSRSSKRPRHSSSSSRKRSTFHSSSRSCFRPSESRSHSEVRQFLDLDLPKDPSPDGPHRPEAFCKDTRGNPSVHHDPGVPSSFL